MDTLELLRSKTSERNELEYQSITLVGPAELTEAASFLSKIPKIRSLKNTSPDWIVPGLIVSGCLHFITGEAGSMKSTFALYIASQISRGGELFGKELNRHKVIYFDRENPDSLITERYELLSVADEENLHYCGMWSPEQPPNIGDGIYRSLVKEFRPVVLVFDSLVRFHNNEENSAREMSQVTGSLRRLCSEGATVIVLHHKGKPRLEGNSPYRGSSEIAAACDIGFSIKKTVTHSEVLLELQCFKNRFEPENNLSFRFDAEAGQFLLEKSDRPLTATLMEQIREVIVGEPGVDVATLLNKTKIPDRKLRKLMRDGASDGKWTVEVRDHGKQVFFPIVC